MWEELIGIVGLLNLSVIHVTKPTLQLSVSTLPSPHLDHTDPVIAVWEPHHHHPLAQAEAGKSCKVFSWHEFVWRVKVQTMATSTVGLLLYSQMLNYPFPPTCLTPPHGGAAAISSSLKSSSTDGFTLGAPWTRKCLKRLPLFQMCVGKIVLTATASDSSKHCSLRITLHLSFAVCYKKVVMASSYF